MRIISAAVTLAVLACSSAGNPPDPVERSESDGASRATDAVSAGRSASPNPCLYQVVDTGIASIVASPNPDRPGHIVAGAVVNKDGSWDAAVVWLDGRGEEVARAVDFDLDQWADLAVLEDGRVLLVGFHEADGRKRVAEVSTDPNTPVTTVVFEGEHLSGSTASDIDAMSGGGAVVFGTARVAESGGWATWLVVLDAQLQVVIERTQNQGGAFGLSVRTLTSGGWSGVGLAAGHSSPEAKYWRFDPTGARVHERSVNPRAFAGVGDAYDERLTGIAPWRFGSITVGSVGEAPWPEGKGGPRDGFVAYLFHSGKFAARARVFDRPGDDWLADVLALAAGEDGGAAHLAVGLSTLNGGPGHQAWLVWLGAGGELLREHHIPLENAMDRHLIRSVRPDADGMLLVTGPVQSQDVTTGRILRVHPSAYQCEELIRSDAESLQ